MFDIPTIWTVYYLEQGPLHSSGFSTELRCPEDREISSQLGEKFLQANEERELGRAPVVPQGPAIGMRKALGRLARRLRLPEVPKLVTASFTVSQLFVIPAEASRLWVLYSGLHLPGLKIKNLQGLTSGGLSRIQASLFTKLTQSRVDMVSHSILVLLTKRKKSQFSPLIDAELKAT